LQYIFCMLQKSRRFALLCSLVCFACFSTLPLSAKQGVSISSGVTSELLLDSERETFADELVLISWEYQHSDKEYLKKRVERNLKFAEQLCGKRELWQKVSKAIKENKPVDLPTRKYSNDVLARLLAERCRVLLYADKLQERELGAKLIQIARELNGRDPEVTQLWRLSRIDFARLNW